MSARPPRASAIYVGRVRHRRLVGTPREFSYRTSWLYLDLDEAAEVFEGHRLWSFDQSNVQCVLRRDLIGGAAAPRSASPGAAAMELRAHVLDRVQSELGHRPKGPVRVLTTPRSFGFAFNPVTFYWCFDRLGVAVEAIVAEITNTPWGERHAYVLDGLAAGSARRVQRFEFAKVFHVSPFQPMEHNYAWAMGLPGPRLVVHMENRTRGEGTPVFDATLTLERRALDSANLGAMFRHHPFHGLGSLAAIYVQAARLFLSRTPFYSHPSQRPPVSTPR